MNIDYPNNNCYTVHIRAFYYILLQYIAMLFITMKNY